MRRTVLSALAIQLALLLALWAQSQVTAPATATRAAWLFIAACLSFVAGVASWPAADRRAEPAPPASEGRPLIAARSFRTALAGLAGVSALLAYRAAAFNTFTSAGVAAWALSVVAFLAATVRVKPGWFDLLRDRLRFPWRIRVQKHHVALLLVFLIAVGFRTYRLAEVPAELGSDQAEKLLDVQDVLNGLRPIFFPRNTGREAFQFYLTALLVRTTPLTLGHLALKVGTVLVSLFAIPWTYLLGKELFDRRLGLLMALLMAISHWHVAISRVGLRFPFTAAFATPTLYFFFRALRLNRRNDWLAAGFFLGVGLHTYIPMRIVPLLLLVLTALKAILDWRCSRRAALPAREVSALQPAFWVNAALGAGLSFLLFMPLFRFMVDRPDLFWYRVTTRSSDALGSQGTSPLLVFLTNLKNAALMFNVRGDIVFSNSVPFSPVLDWVTGALFVLGLALAWWRLLRHRDRRSLYLFACLFVLLLPSTLSIAYPGENPSVVRTGGAIPIAMLLAALPLWWLWGQLQGSFGRPGRAYAALAMVALLTLALRANAEWYFVTYDRQFRLSIWNASEMGRVVRGFADSLGDLDHAYHVAYPYWVDTRAIGINAGDINWYEHAAILDLPMALPVHAADPAPKLYILNTADTESLQALTAQYEEGRLKRFPSAVDPGKDFWVFTVPGER